MRAKRRFYHGAITAQPVEIRLLDTPAVVVAGEARLVARPREQAVLVRLALAAPRAVPIDVLVADVWGLDAPPRAVHSLRVHVSNLRKVLAHAGLPGSEILRMVPGGYYLDVPEQAVDVGRLELAVRNGAIDELRALVEVWPDHDFARLDAGSGFFDATARRVDHLRLAAVETVTRADLDAGRPEAALALLEVAVARAPHREPLWELLVRALVGAGRRAEALRAFQRARNALADIGIEPSAALIAAEADALDDGPLVQADELTSHYVDVDGSRIAFATLGRHEVDLLFLHGGFVPFDVMRETRRLARFIGELAKRFRVIFVDRRGIGMSDGPANGARITLDHWVADCRAVLDAVGSRQVVVLGHEHGGPVAIRLAAELPDRVKGLVLHSTAARPLRSPDHPYGPSDDVVEYLDRMIDRLPGHTDMLTAVAPSAGNDPALRAWLDRAGRLGAGPARARELHRAYLDADVRAALPDVRARTIVLYPARLLRGDPGRGRYLAEHIPDAELQLLDSGDHLFWLADADVVLAALDRLIARITDAAASPPPRLRAIVAVAPPLGADILTAHGAETCVVISDAIVATFTSLAAARSAADVIRASTPGAVITIDAADTTSAASDDAILMAAARAAAAVASTSPTPARHQPIDP